MPPFYLPPPFLHKGGTGKVHPPPFCPPSAIIHVQTGHKCGSMWDTPPPPFVPSCKWGWCRKGQATTPCAGMGRGPLPLLEACAPGTPHKPRSSPPSPFVCKGGMQTRDTHTNLDASPLFVCGGDTKQGVWERGGPPPPSACKGSHELKWWHPCEQRAAWKAPFLLSFPPLVFCALVIIK